MDGQLSTDYRLEFRFLDRGLPFQNKPKTPDPYCKMDLDFLLRQGYRYHKLCKAFSNFYRRHFDLVSKYNAGLKTFLLQGLSEPEFYGDLVYKFSLSFQEDNCLL